MRPPGRTPARLPPAAQSPLTADHVDVLSQAAAHLRAREADLEQTGPSAALPRQPEGSGREFGHRAAPRLSEGDASRSKPARAAGKELTAERGPRFTEDVSVAR